MQQPQDSVTYSIAPSAALADELGQSILGRVSAISAFDSEDAFNRFCQSVTAEWKEVNRSQFPTFPEFSLVMDAIRAGDKGSIQTSWGGVLVKVHEHPHVEKYLAVIAGRYLAFEKHDLKEETLAVQGGLGLIVYRAEPNMPLKVEALKPGNTIYLAPGREHCVIALNDLLIYETSEDHKGMDKDLIFIYLPGST